MGWPDGTVSPGEVFYDRLSDGRYEKCILGPAEATGEAKRGGTGQFFKAVSPADLPEDISEEDYQAWEKQTEDAEMIMDADKGIFVFLVPV